MNYMDIANSPAMLVLCAVPVCIVIVMAFIFMRTAWREGIRIGMSAQAMKKIISTSAIFSIIPSLAVLLMLTALTFMLGKYFPWLRLSVIGSGIYETMAANMAISSFGLTEASQMTPVSFLGVMMVMTTGILVGAILNVVLLKKYDTVLKGGTKEPSPFIPFMITAMFIGILVEWVAPGILDFDNTLGIIAMATGLVSMLALLWLERRPGCKNLENFSMSLAMVCGMVAAILGKLLMA